MVDVFVAARQPLLRLGVRAALETVPDCRVVGEADGVEGLCRSVVESGADVLLMESSLRDEEPELIPHLRECMPDTRIVVLVDHDEDACVLRALARQEQPWRLAEDALHALDDCCLTALRSHARGCVPRNATPERLLAAVRGVASGEVVAGPWLAARWETNRAALAAGDQRPRVTARELEVVRGVARGLSNKEIARRMGIRERTVKNHLARITGKLQVDGRVELTTFALRHKLDGAPPGRD